MRRSTVAVFLVVLACTRASRPIVANRAASDSVLALIHVHGPRVALDSMFRDPATDERWSDSIATGDSVWLRVAKELRPASDAATSESLDQALARALPNAPEAVLRLLAEAPFDEDWVCGLPFFEGTPDSTISNHKRRTLAALRAVRSPDLADRRDACLRTLDHA